MVSYLLSNLRRLPTARLRLSQPRRTRIHSRSRMQPSRRQHLIRSGWMCASFVVVSSPFYHLLASSGDSCKCGGRPVATMDRYLARARRVVIPLLIARARRPLKTTRSVVSTMQHSRESCRSTNRRVYFGLGSCFCISSRGDTPAITSVSAISLASPRLHQPSRCSGPSA